MIIAIDGTNWVHACWHAMKRQLGPQQILDVFLRRIDVVARNYSASAVLVAFDRRSFRHDLLAGYKANRPAKEPGLQQMLDEAPAAVGRVGQLIYADGYEADDLLATAAAIAVQRGQRAILCSADKDVWQCLASKQVAILRSVDTSEGEVIGSDWFNEDALYHYPAKQGEAKKKVDPYCLRPWQWADFQALVGQPGDNIPGCPLWGEKTSAPALVKFGSIDGMLKKLWELKCTSSQQTALTNWHKSPSGRKVATACVQLHNNVPAVWDALR
jgi:DNA polymerase I